MLSCSETASRAIWRAISISHPKGGDMDQSGQAQQVRWKVDGLTVAGMAWGPADGHPILAMHGWLDNAGSFEVLAPMLSDCRVVAVDLTGHGLTDSRSLDSSYLIWKDLPQLFKVIEELGWSKCTLLGHSRGAAIATLTAAAMPERTHSLITVDGLVPQPADDSDFASQLQKGLQFKQRRASPRYYTSPDEYIQRRQAFGVSQQIAQRLSTRALEKTDKGYRLRNDRRLYAPSAVKLNRAQIESVFRALSMPVLNIWASDGFGEMSWAQDMMDLAAETVDDLTMIDVEGHHHMHLEPGPAAEIAGHIRSFIGERASGRVAP